MRKFIGRKIRVETAGDSADPAVVIDGDQRWEVVSVERTWFDAGHGGTPVGARTWRTRRQRKNFVLLTADGARLTIYLDYQRPEDRVWHLVTVEESDR